jgi:hypothetical protein
MNKELYQLLLAGLFCATILTGMLIRAMAEKKK